MRILGCKHKLQQENGNAAVLSSLDREIAEGGQIKSKMHDLVDYTVSSKMPLFFNLTLHF